MDFEKLLDFDLTSREPLTESEIGILKNFRALILPNFFEDTQKIEMYKKEYSTVDQLVESAINKFKFILGDDKKLPNELIQANYLLLRVLDSDVFELGQVVDKDKLEYYTDYIRKLTDELEKLL